MSDYMIGCKVYKVNGQEIKFYYDENRIGQVTVEAMDAIIDRLNNSVEVVRCKDCKHKHARKESGKSPIFCDFGIGNQLDDFCSYGERAEK